MQISLCGQFSQLFDALYKFNNAEKRCAVQQPGFERGIAEVKFGTGGGNKATAQFFAPGRYKQVNMLLQIFQVAKTEVFYHERDYIRIVTKGSGNNAYIGAV